MSRTLSEARLSKPDHVVDVADLLLDASRSLVLTLCGIYLCFQVVATIGWPHQMSSQLWIIAPAVAITFGAALWLLPRSLPAAEAVWHLGLMAVITLAIYLFQEPLISLSYVLLPLMAATAVGWEAGLLSEGLIVATLLGLARAPGLPPFPHGLVGAVAGVGGAAGTIGWVHARSLLSVVRSSLANYDQWRRKTEEARAQSLELKQVQQDLVLANRELARLSERLKVMYQVAQEARQAKEEFVANVSHELRTPLNMILGFSELITQSPAVYGDQLPGALLADITVIRRNSQHLARLINDVLDLSQIEARRMALSKAWVPVPPILEDAIEVVKPLFESKGLYLRMHVPDELAPLHCDELRIRQVLINLLSNAGRFTEQGGVTLRVRQEVEELRISVADTGPGIAESEQERIFEPFQQLDGSLRRQHGGSGLGLSISRRFVEMHEGRMWLDSQVGVGTTIGFSLPCRAPVAEEEPRWPGRRWFSPYSEYEYRIRTRRSKAPMAPTIPRYVVVDDQGTLTHLFDHYPGDIDIVPVSSIESACAELDRSPAQALIVNTPSAGDGHPMAWLPTLPYGTPVALCWMPGGDETAGKLGAMRYLTKPVTREQLLAALDALGSHIRKVLLVDDDPEVVQLFTRMLISAQREYDVVSALDGRRALALLAKHRPDVVLLDLVMPGTDGMQLLKAIDEDPALRETPVIIVSARDPGGGPVVSEVMSFGRSGGLSSHDVLACIEAFADALIPPC